MEYVLTTEGLSKSYGKSIALNDLSMHVPKGAIYGVIGRNGAGKTTLIRLICGLQEPTAGKYTLLGKNGTEKDIIKSRRRMGAVVETPAIFTNMTARENLKQQYRILGLPTFDGIDELLELVGIAEEAERKASKFSLGMRQRLGIAIALCGDPDFLVLDEPLNGVDPQGVVQIRELLVKLNKEKQVTILISSHVLEELSKVATHYGILDKGMIVKEISAEELEASCKKCMYVEVSDTRALSRVLDAKGYEYSIVSEYTAEVYGSIGVSELVHLLEDEGCELRKSVEKESSLESYYLNLIGGGDHA